jgi:hypothetical protein
LQESVRAESTACRECLNKTVSWPEENEVLPQRLLLTRLWTPSLCVNYSSIPERNGLNAKMRLLYRNASSIIIWLGPDNPARHAHLAISAIDTISTWLCSRLAIPLSDIRSPGSKFNSPVFSHRGTLPPPTASPVGTDATTWAALAWFFSNPYFARAQAVHELHSTRGGDRLVLCGTSATEWSRVRLVAEYVVMSTAFSRLHGFAGTCAWWASSADELMSRSDNWLQMLYLASNYTFADPRDFVYDLYDFMKFKAGKEILAPDYSKSVVEVYRDSVEASIVNFNHPDALLYASDATSPSWIPLWNEPKLFRNPFRLGKLVPWQPSGPDAVITWSIDKPSNILSVSGFVVGSIKAVAPYNETIFGNAAAQSKGELSPVAVTWSGILSVISTTQPSLPLSPATVVAVATTLSFGVDEKCEPADETRLAANFVAYLAGTLREDVFRAHIGDQPGLPTGGDGLSFGKPVWDFKYPTSGFFVTEQGFVGACVTEIREGDVVVVPSRSSYPLVLRPVGDGTFELRGYAFVYGVMKGELAGTAEVVSFKIR